MRALFLIPFLITTAAFAQNDGSMLVIGGAKDPRPASAIEQERVMQQFPDWAVTRAGAVTGGYDQDVPTAPAAPASPSTEATPKSPPTPAIPSAPANPANKLWPADTVPIFMKSCVSYQPKLVVPCSCIIHKLMTAMPHDEFLKLTAAGTVEDDIRLQNIRVECAVKAAARQ